MQNDPFSVINLSAISTYDLTINTFSAIFQINVDKDIKYD